MVTNTSEYQKEYQREYRKTHPQKQYKKSKEVKLGSKEVKKEMLEISLARLRPPREVDTPGLKENVRHEAQSHSHSENSAGSQASEMDLDFNAIARSSDFQRFIIFLAKKITPGIFKGVNTRKSNIVMISQFNQKKADYRAVMSELKEVLRKRNENKN